MNSPARLTPAWLLSIGLVSMALFSLLLWLYAPIHRPQDEGLLLVYPDLISRGLLPHRDFLASYPPGNFFFLSAIYTLFEPSLVVERSVGFFYRCALVFGIVSLAASRGPAIATLCGFATTAALLPLRLEAFNWIGGVAALTWAGVALSSCRFRTAGLLLGLAVSFRIDLFPAAGFLCAAGMLPSRHGSWTKLKRLLQGGVVTLLPLILYFVFISPQNSLRDLLVDPIFVSGPARRLGFDALGPTGLRFFLLLLLSAVCVLLAGWREREFSSTIRTPALAAAALVLGVLPQAFQRLDVDHILYSLIVVAGLLPAAIDRLLHHRFNSPAILGVCAAVLLTTLGPPSFALLRSSIAGEEPFRTLAWLHRGERTLPARGRGEVLAFAELGQVLDSLSIPGDRLFIGPADLSRTNYADLHLYFLFPDLSPASYYIELNPNSANRLGTRLTDDLRQADWLLLSREWDRWDESNSSGAFGDSRPNAVVRNHFAVVAHSGLWTLHHRRKTP